MAYMWCIVCTIATARMRTKGGVSVVLPPVRDFGQCLGILQALRMHVQLVEGHQQMLQVGCFEKTICHSHIVSY